MVTDKHTQTQTDYCNPAAHALRVNYGVTALPVKLPSPREQGAKSPKLLFSRPDQL